MLVFSLTGCDNWQSGLDEVQNAQAPSWDLKLSIPLLPATTVNVGEEIYAHMEEEDLIEKGQEEIEDLSIKERFELFDRIELAQEIEGNLDLTDYQLADSLDFNAEGSVVTASTADTSFSQEGTLEISLPELPGGIKTVSFGQGDIFLKVVDSEGNDLSHILNLDSTIRLNGKVLENESSSGYLAGKTLGMGSQKIISMILVILIRSIIPVCSS